MALRPLHYTLPYTLTLTFRVDALKNRQTASMTHTRQTFLAYLIHRLRKDFLDTNQHNISMARRVGPKD